MGGPHIPRAAGRRARGLGPRRVSAGEYLVRRRRIHSTIWLSKEESMDRKERRTTYGVPLASPKVGASGAGGGELVREPYWSRRGFLAAVPGGVAAAAWLASCSQEAGQVGADGDAIVRPSGLDDSAWADVRSRFALEAGTSYMNNASLGMPPASVAQAVARGYEGLSVEPIRAKQELNRKLSEQVMPRLARYLGAGVDEIALTRNATEALHAAAVGADISAGDEVIITTQEHPAGRRPWRYRAAREGLNVREVFVPSPFSSGAAVVDIIAEAITPATRAIGFCHVTRGGHLSPVRELCALARAEGIISCVDGAQAVGMIPVNLSELGCDAYSASLHKWFLGPSGTGFLYVRAGSRDRVRSAFDRPEAGGTGAGGSYAPPGTADLPVRAALAAALDFGEALGNDAIADRTRFLSDYLKERVRDMPGVTLLSGPTRETSCPGSTIFEIEGVDAVASVPVVAERAHIHIDEHRRDGHDAIRVSTHVYNTTAEIDRLVEVLTKL